MFTFSERLYWPVRDNFALSTLLWHIRLHTTFVEELPVCTQRDIQCETYVVRVTSATDTASVILNEMIMNYSQGIFLLIYFGFTHCDLRSHFTFQHNAFHKPFTCSIHQQTEYLHLDRLPKGIQINLFIFEDVLSTYTYQFDAKRIERYTCKISNMT